MPANYMQAFFDSTPDAILTVNREDRRILSFSKGAERIFGYSSSEVVGKNVNILMPNPDHSSHEKYVENYQRTGVKKIIGTVREVRGRKKDGTVIDIDLSISESSLRGDRVYHSSFKRADILQHTLEIMAANHPFPVSVFYVYDEWGGDYHCAASVGANAVKFTPDNGKVILAGKRIMVDEKEILEISVTDTGIGIAPEDQDRLFRPFEQLDSSMGRKYLGTGLGLAMIKELAELHGGSVAVESAVGKGSRT